jgi:hypothetical protein
MTLIGITLQDLEGAKLPLLKKLDPMNYLMAVRVSRMKPGLTLKVWSERMTSLKICGAN